MINFSEYGEMSDNYRDWFKSLDTEDQLQEAKAQQVFTKLRLRIKYSVTS